MLTLLAFQHRHLQVFQMSPCRLQSAPIMPIANKLVGIPTSTRGTLPVNRTLSATHLTRNSLHPSSFASHLGFQKFPQHRPDRLYGGGLGLLLHDLKDG